MKLKKKIIIMLFCCLILSCKTILMNNYSKDKDKFNHKTLPNIQLYDEKNNLYNVGETDSKVTMINFWGTWCPPCLKELPEINKLIINLREESDIDIINACVDCPIDEWKGAILENDLLGINLRVDTSSSKLLYIWSDNEGLPFNIVLDSEKEIVATNILELKSAQLMTVYALLNVKDGWTGGQSFRHFIQKTQNKYKKSSDDDRFYQFFEKYAEKYADD